MLVSIRSSLSAGIAAAVVAAGAGVAAVAPVASAPLPLLASPAVQLSALASALPKPAAAALPTKPTTNPFGGGGTASTPGERIINSYNAIQPWVQYSVELGAWGVGWLPWPIGLIAPQMNIGYSGVEPISRAVTYSVAYAVDGKWDLIQPTIKNGIQTGVNNLIQGEAAWIASYFPPLPPLGAATVPAAPRAAARAAAATGVKPVATVKAAAAEVSTPVIAPADPAPPAQAAPVAASAKPTRSNQASATRTKAARGATKATPRAAAGVKAGRAGH